jgi:predicted ferric reductase
VLLNGVVVSLLLHVVLGMEVYIIHDYTFIISLLFTIHDKIIMLIGTWRTTQKNSATTRVVWDALGLLIRKASGGLPYSKGARPVGEWSV